MPINYENQAVAIVAVLLVCKFWHDFAIGTASLWATVVVYRGVSRSSTIIRWLDRARHVPLHVFISSDSYQPRHQRARRFEDMAVIPELIRRMPQWESLHLAMVVEDVKAVFRASSFTMPILVSSEIRILDRYSVDRVDILSIAAPRLKSLASEQLVFTHCTGLSYLHLK
ncbi:hypothetical protein FRB96_002503 [Tulasnella sp. 330]|nr:hypothetical protein FRB96_002503 [Tulasnella sp. 330]